MRKKAIKIISVMLSIIILFSTNCLYASTYVISTIEKRNFEIGGDSIMPTPAEVLNIPFGFILIFLKGFVILLIFYFLANVICKFIINKKSELKSYTINQKLGKIMDRMYEYKRDA